MFVWSLSYSARKAHAQYQTVTFLAVTYFPALSHKQHDLRGKFIEHKKRGLIFSTTSGRFLVIDQLDAKILFNVFIYSSLHVSSMSCSSSGETNCISTVYSQPAHDTAHQHGVTITRSCTDTICFS